MTETNGTNEPGTPRRRPEMQDQRSRPGSFGVYAYGFISMLCNFTGHIPVQTIRMALYRWLFKVKAGRGTNIYRACELRSPWRIRIGEGTSIGDHCILDGRAGLVIGSSVNLSTGVWIWTQQHDKDDRHFKVVGKGVIIEDYAWLGGRVIVLPGVRIGRGAVVASGSIVTKDVPPYAVMAGMPARKVGERSQDLDYRIDSHLPFL